MEMTTVDEAKRLAEQRRQTAILKAIGLDRVQPEQREVALAIAKRYELDLMLKHLVLVDGKPYITRDGLLHVAHRSGQLDGIEVTDPVLEDNYWRARCSVYRKDMSRPFTYAGRYPAKGGNQKFAPEMAVKVSEVMALRRAFDISAPVIEERWDRDDIAPIESEPTITDSIAAAQARVTTTIDPAGAPAATLQQSPPETGNGDRTVLPPLDARPVPPSAGSADQSKPTPADEDEAAGVPLSPVAESRCEGFDKELGPCKRDPGHNGNHANKDGESWA